MFRQHSTILEPVSVKAGLFLTFKDGDIIRAYRRFDIDCIIYMAIATEKS